MSRTRGVIVTVAVITLIVGVAIGGWQLGWWMNAYSVNRTAHIYQTSYGTQSAYAEELQRLIVQIDGVDVQIADPSTPADEVSALQAQKLAMVNQGCDLASKLTIAPAPNVRQFITINC